MNSSTSPPAAVTTSAQSALPTVANGASAHPEFVYPLPYSTQPTSTIHLTPNQETNSSQWKEALDYATSQCDSKSATSNPVAPKVHLHATSEKALDAVKLEDLKKYAAESEAGNASNVAQSRKGGMGGAIKERSELAGKGDMTSREL